MKVLLSLAFMCCFIGGILASSCGCKGTLKECFCKHDHVIRARIKQLRVVREEFIDYELEKKKDFRGKSDFKFVRVPKGCRKELDTGDVVLLMGKKKDKETLITPAEGGLGYIKLFNTLKNDQITFMNNKDSCP